MQQNQQDYQRIEGHALALYRAGQFTAVLQQALPYLQNSLLSQCQALLEIAADSANRIGNIDLAIQLWMHFLKNFPKHKMGYLSLADILCRQSRFAEADACFQSGLSETGPSVELGNNYAIFLQSRGRTAEAEQYYRRAIDARPDIALPCGNLAALLRQQERFGEAEGFYKLALEREPNNRDYWFSMVRLYISMEQYAKAEATMDQLLQRFPQKDGQETILYAELDSLQERHAAAEARYREAMGYPKYLFDAYFAYATYLGNNKRSEQALEYYQKAGQIRPDDANVYLNMGTVYQEDREYDRAAVCYDRARTMNPDLMDAYANLGIVLYKSNRWQEAEAVCRMGLSRKADHHRTRFTLGYVLLSQGRLDEGWPFYESRYCMEGTKKTPLLAPPLSFPQWRGEDLRGKTILIWNEQGTGDLIQFARLFPLLQEKGVAAVNVICAPGNRDLVQGMGGVDRVYCFGEDNAVPHHHYWCFALSLPLYLGINQHNAPRNIPYIVPQAEYVSAWREKLLDSPGLKVGLVWKGSPKNVVDKDRSLHDMMVLQPILDIPGISFISLQKDCAEEIEQNAAQHKMICYGDDLQHFADTAGLIANLDLVVTVDTSVAHLAGAMGKPVWMMIPFSADWRWLTGVETSHWYPTMRIFRQKKRGDWPAVIARIAADLDQWQKTTPLAVRR